MIAETRATLLSGVAETPWYPCICWAKKRTSAGCFCYHTRPSHTRITNTQMQPAI